ncbi:hypothetical protein NE237_012522 [Protea cynaroides]|uniref:Uncharacterized protein n=1 Tax=Protea cynaroides TaxID=273540 RepID=A0A9Q0GY42_9MAGN|nr:hypothetical protein NE237_012522 [Protea cynaroides]
MNRASIKGRRRVQRQRGFGDNQAVGALRSSQNGEFTRVRGVPYRGQPQGGRDGDAGEASEHSDKSSSSEGANTSKGLEVQGLNEGRLGVFEKTGSKWELTVEMVDWPGWLKAI